MLVEALKQRVLHAEVRLEFEEAGVGLPRMTVYDHGIALKDPLDAAAFVVTAD